jgi:hypothetical protein
LDPELIKQGGLAIWGFAATTAAIALWRALQAERRICRACGKGHAEQLLTLGHTVAVGLEHSTAAISASQRQDEILNTLRHLKTSGPTGRKATPDG